MDTKRLAAFIAVYESGSMAYLGRRFVKEFEDAHPGLTLRIQEGNDLRVRELVSSGAVECGFTAGPVNHEPYVATLFSRHPHCLVVRADDPLAAKGFTSNLLTTLTRRFSTLRSRTRTRFACTASLAASCITTSSWTRPLP